MFLHNIGDYINKYVIFHRGVGDKLCNISQRGWGQASLLTANALVSFSTDDRISQMIILQLQKYLFQVDGHHMESAIILTKMVLWSVCKFKYIS